MIIEQIYVVNLKHRKDRWNKIQQAFNNTGLKLTKWDAIYGKTLSDEQINNITSKFCYYFCSPGMIGCWMSHYLLWQFIVKNKCAGSQWAGVTPA